MAYVYSGDNPSQLYKDSLVNLMTYGGTYTPRGKEIKEIRPAIFEFTNPYNRVTFLRRINPFFQLAESWWILSGRADVATLEKYNSNIAQFSDDGVYFNAPYGERMRTWNKNSAHNIIINPIDQLADVYLKLINDCDTRQAVISLYNPMLDNSVYTIGEQGKDICCLTGDTVIATPNGDMLLKELVELVNSGKHVEVYTYDTSAFRQVVIKPVVSALLTRKNAKLVELTIDNGSTIKLTPDHKVYLFDTLWLVEAEHLHCGDRLLGIDGEGHKITNINWLIEPEDVYDIEVADTHTFYANGILVHNCNLTMTFKIRDNRLNMTVFNRSNDIHWGLFGANLCQFSTIQETLLSFLQAHYKDLKIGTYTHVTDSLHTYTKDYSGDISPKVLTKEVPPLFTFDTEPRMSLTFEDFNQLCSKYWEEIDPYMSSDEYISSLDIDSLFSKEFFIKILEVQDKYWRMVFLSMLVYRLIKLGERVVSLFLLENYIPNSSWKVSEVYFLKKFIMSSSSDIQNKYNEITQNLTIEEPKCVEVFK